MALFRRLLLLAALGSLVTGIAFGQEDARRAIEIARLNNVGVAFMNQQLPDRALQRFTAAEKLDPRGSVPLLNEGIALLYMQKLPEAAKALEASATNDEGSPRPWYCLGILHLGAGDPAAAQAALRQAVARDPHDADAHYFLGTADLKLGDYPAALTEFTEALQVNPLHASAEFGLARALQRTGATDKARMHLARFQELTDKKNGTTVSAQYSEQGRYALAEEMHLPLPAVDPMIPVQFLAHPLAGSVAKHSHSAAESGAGLCVLDLDGTGEKTILAVGDGEKVIRAFRFKDNETTELNLEESGLTVSGHGIACAVGDWDNDGLPDVAIALTDRVVLFRNLGHGHFADVTAKAGLKPANHPSGLSFVDFDHDGDLDLFVTGSPSGPGLAPNVLWRNNGDLTFTEWTNAPALEGTAETTSVAVSDLNNDRAIDFVVAGKGSSPAVYLNRREGPFERGDLYTGAPLLPATRGVAIADFDKDGWMDVVVTHAGSPGASLWHNDAGKGFTRIPLPLSGVQGAWGVTPLDFDNDGWIDLAVLAETAKGPQLRILRNCGKEGFKDVTQSVGLSALDLTGARSVVVADLQNRGSVDLVVGREGNSPVVLQNVGANRHHSLRIQLAGLADNKSAIGTKVEVFADGLWQKFELTGSAGLAGQAPLEIVAGLGMHAHVDIVRLLWPTGVPQDELDVRAGETLSIKESDRRGSSCPVLFAWNGREYQFISDVIGAAVVGHWISPVSNNASDSDEWIKVDGEALQPRNGRLSLRFGEPMEEINYIDQLRLLAVDHPEDTAAYPNERFMSEPPFADGKTVIASSQTHALAGAWDNEGVDVRKQLSARDHAYVRDFTNLSYAGFAQRHTLTLDLGSWSAIHPLRLFLDGYIEYFSASSMYAAWQAGLQPEPPSIDAQLPDGTWTRIVDDAGFPAGLPRTIVVDLTKKLPAGTQRIRLTTNLQIYWDRIVVDNGPDVSAAAVQREVPLASAQLAFRGYPKQIEGATPGDLTYDYRFISATGPFQWQRGPYTRFGEVAPLLRARDDRYVIFGSGEEIDAEFDPGTLPALPRHWKRDYFFYADGFVKDMDFYEAMPFTVTELPFHHMSAYPYSSSEQYPRTPENDLYQLDWNDRYESGTRLQRFDFHYGQVDAGTTSTSRNP